ncbi:palmitoyltransferase ZDHHC4 isoform X2 [Macrotis lagotis]|uniref:palmitoyltransferase ZDHHC4 isoform X2 n=1 Tax=Macrotis lagotis TaxID=92651 RepID=UPI003D68A280
MNHRYFHVLYQSGFKELRKGYFITSSIHGIITKSNEASILQVYEYDEVIFLKNMKCPTCNLRKPARSKHCSVCNICVHRFDHHCIWVNNCIGALNARYFLIYLLTLTAMAADIAIITTTFLIHLVLISNMSSGTYFDDHGQEQPVDIAFLIQHLFLTFPRIVFMLGFIIILTFLLGGYVCFTLYLAITNQTSNEWYKSSRAKCHRCHNKDPVQEKPSIYRNIYAKGAWNNLQEILKPITVYKKKN